MLLAPVTRVLLQVVDRLSCGNVLPGVIPRQGTADGGHVFETARK